MSILTFLVSALLCAAVPEGTDCFEKWFTDSTLRLDYVFAGNASSQRIYLMEACRTGLWAGRRQHLDQALLKGNGEIRLMEPESGQTLYVTAFHQAEYFL